MSIPIIKSAEKWEKVLTLNEKIQWRKIYGLPFNCVKETKIQCFQYKLLHRILPSNKFLYQIRYIDKPNCSFYDNEDETLEHLFFQCQYVFSLWESLKVYLQVNIDLNLNLSLQTILFGIVDQTSAKSANYIILLTNITFTYANVIIAS